MTLEPITSPLARPFDFPAGEHGVLLIHGLTGTPAHMRLLGEGLRDRGFAVRGICLPGHGETPQAMAGFAWQDWLLAAREAARDMAGRYPRFSVCGLSMGGLLALLLAQEGIATACVTIAAPMKTVNKLRPLAPVIAPICPVIPKRVDPARATLNGEYDVGYEVTPTASYRHLSVLMRRARQHLALIHCPVLAIQSHGDQVVTADSPDIILNGVSSAVKARLWLDQAPHVCTISPEYPKIVEAMAEFLKKSEGQADAL
ncbi:MAG: alpha/beta fold hydrolase [Clostridia bacterium]|nr:alpha/beta fold hydrolase [Clostridia bacterium]